MHIKIFVFQAAQMKKAQNLTRNKENKKKKNKRDLKRSAVEGDKAADASKEDQFTPPAVSPTAQIPLKR